MKLILLFLFMLAGIEACEKSSKEETQQTPVLRTIAPVFRTITPRDCVMSEYVALLPANRPLIKSLLEIYNTPSHMSTRNKEVVNNPFDRLYFDGITRNNTVWVLLSRDGVFGHIVVDIKDLRDHAYVCQIICLSATELAKETPLVEMGLFALMKSRAVSCDEWKITVYQGNNSVRKLLKSMGFHTTAPDYIMVSYQKPASSINPELL